MDKLLDVMQTAIKTHWDHPADNALLDEASVTAGSITYARGKPALSRRRVQSMPTSVSPRLHAPAFSSRVLPVENEVLVRNRLVAALQTSTERETYCLLQAAVLERIERGVIGVTGPHRGGGRTLTATNLAISLAIDGCRDVIIADLDLSAPSLHRIFDIEPSAGIEDCLFKGVTLDDAMFSPALDRLAVLPARGGSESVSQILRSPSLRALIARLKERFADAMIVLDLPPVLGPDDAAAYEALSDAILLVVENDTTRASDYKRVLECFGQRKLIGTVLNRAVVVGER